MDTTVYPGIHFVGLVPLKRRSKVRRQHRNDHKIDALLADVQRVTAERNADPDYSAVEDAAWNSVEDSVWKAADPR